MKKKVLIAFLLVLATGILIFVATRRTDSASDEDRARQNLISIVENIDEKSNDSDYLSEDGSKLVIRNSSTREFLLKILKTAKVEETTGTISATWPTPFYYVSEEYIGGNFTLCSTYNNRSFSFFIEGKNRTYFSTYIAAMEQARELFGIECTDDPSYSNFLSDKPNAQGN